MFLTDRSTQLKIKELHAFFLCGFLLSELKILKKNILVEINKTLPRWCSTISNTNY